MEVTTIGLDLAKNIFQVHGITEDEEVAFNRPLRRAQLLPFFSKIKSCLIGMEDVAVRIIGLGSQRRWATMSD